MDEDRGREIEREEMDTTLTYLALKACFIWTYSRNLGVHGMHILLTGMTM